MNNTEYKLNRAVIDFGLKCIEIVLDYYRERDDEVAKNLDELLGAKNSYTYTRGGTKEE